MGMRLLEAGPGHARLQLDIGPTHLNGLGVGHGGVLFTLADVAMSYASNVGLGADRRAYTVSADIDFLAPVPPDSLIEAVATSVASAGRTTVHDVEVRLLDPSGATDAEESVVAVFRGRTRQVDVPVD